MRKPNVEKRLNELEDKIKVLEQEKRQLVERSIEQERITAQLTSLIENLQMGILVEDDSHNIIHVNPEFCRLFGIPLQHKLIGTNYTESARQIKGFFVESEKFVKRIDELLAAQKIFLNEEFVLTDGRIFEQDYIPIKKGKILSGHLWIYRDVSAFRQSQVTIQESEAKFRNVAEQSPNMIFLNLGGKIVYANKKCEEYTGYTLEELYSRDFNFLTLIPPEYVDLVKDNFKKHMNGEEVPPYEYVIISKAGERFNVIITTKLINYESKKAILGIVTDITERKKAEEMLRSSEQEKESILDCLVEHVIYEDTEMKILWANQAACKSAGLTREELIGRHCYEIWPNRNEACPDCPVMKAIKTNQLQEIEKSTSDGRYWFIRGYPVRDDEGNIVAGIQVTLEITEHKKAEEELRESEERYRSLTDNLNVGVYRITIGPRGKFIEANPAIVSMFGFDSREEFLAVSVAKLYQNLEDWKVFNEKMIKKGFVRNEELPLRMKNGTAFWCSVSGVAVKDKTGRIKYYDGIIEDITKRKQVEEALIESEERYRTLIEDSPIAIVVHSEGNVVYINSAALKLIGATSDQELLGKPVMEFVHPDYRRIARKRIKKLYDKKGKAPLVEEKFIKMDGQVIDVEVTGKLINFRGKPASQVIIHDITSRKKAESALQESEKRYRHIVESAKDMIYRTDAKGKFIFVNPIGVKLVGYSEEEYKRKSYLDMIRQDYKKQAKKFFTKQFIKRIPNTYFEFPIVTRDGKEIWLGQNVQIIIEGNKVVGFQALSRDITDRKLAEDEKQKSHALLEATLESTADGILVVDNNGKWSGYNQQFAKMWRIPDQILSTKDDRTALDFVLDQLKDPNGFITKVKELYNQPEAESLDIIHFKDERIFERFSKPQRIGNKIVGRVWSFRDITTQRRTDKALRESEAKYRNLIQHSGDAIYLLYNRQFELINDKFEEMFGLTLEEVNKPDFDFINLVASKSRPMIEERVKRLVKGEKLEPKYEFTALTADGKELEVEASVTYIKYKNGTATQGIIRDVTERKRLEDQLRQAQKMEAVGQLAGGVAHDFNNLLTVINGYCDMLLYRDLPDKVQGPVKQIHKAGEQATRLTSQLLAFSRKQVIQPKILNLNDLILNQNKILGRMLGEDIEIELHLSPELNLVKVDPGQVEQMVINLAVNARDAMPYGGKLTIETANAELDEDYVKNHAGARPGQYVILAICDNGVGMDGITRSRIFEPFFTTKGREKGTGLGLATVYGIVKQNRGLIYVYSELQKGTTFKIYLPQVETLKDSDKSSQESQQDFGGSETILLVEDDPGVLELTRSTLTHYGYTVLTATNGAEALQLFNKSQEKIELLLTDVIMPVMAGKELARKLLQVEPELKIIYFSGYTDNAIAHHGVLDSKVTFIQKPYSRIELAKKIRRVLDE